MQSQLPFLEIALWAENVARASPLGATAGSVAVAYYIVSMQLCTSLDAEFLNDEGTSTTTIKRASILPTDYLTQRILFLALR